MACLIPLCPATQVAQAGASIPMLAHTAGCALVCYLGIVDIMHNVHEQYASLSATQADAVPEVN